jgi:hypothetical protein
VALEMVFNELSLQMAADIRTARSWMEAFIQAVNAATSHGVSRVIRTKNDILNITLAVDYPLLRWLNDQEVDIEMRRYIMVLTTKVPFWEDLPDLHDNVLAHEFIFDGRKAEGLGVAYLLESLAVSLPSEESWNSALLILNAKRISEDDQLEEKTIEVIHASCPSHVDEHIQWISEHLYSGVQDGPDLWNRRAELFPSLAFCEAVGERIQSLSPTMLNPVVRCMSDLEAYCRGWSAGRFDSTQLARKATRESQATLNQYGTERNFLCPGGERRIFSWHVRLTPHSWRVYFDPEPRTRTMIIGYVGPHLPTARHP